MATKKRAEPQPDARQQTFTLIRDLIAEVDERLNEIDEALSQYKNPPEGETKEGLVDLALEAVTVLREELQGQLALVEKIARKK